MSLNPRVHDDDEEDCDYIFTSSPSKVDGRQGARVPHEDANNDEGRSTTATWIGIDLGTTNCTCAIWDTEHCRPRLVPLPSLAQPWHQDDNDDDDEDGGMQDKVVPSSVTLLSSDADSGPRRQKDEYKLRDRWGYVGGYPSVEMLHSTIVREERPKKEPQGRRSEEPPGDAHQSKKKEQEKEKAGVIDGHHKDEEDEGGHEDSVVPSVQEGSAHNSEIDGTKDASTIRGDNKTSTAASPGERYPAILDPQGGNKKEVAGISTKDSGPTKKATTGSRTSRGSRWWPFGRAAVNDEKELGNDRQCATTGGAGVRHYTREEIAGATVRGTKRILGLTYPSSSQDGHEDDDGGITTPFGGEGDGLNQLHNRQQPPAELLSFQALPFQAVPTSRATTGGFKKGTTIDHASTSASGPSHEVGMGATTSKGEAAAWIAARVYPLGSERQFEEMNNRREDPSTSVKESDSSRTDGLLRGHDGNSAGNTYVDVTPVEIATILLRTIRLEAERTLTESQSRRRRDQRYTPPHQQHGEDGSNAGNDKVDAHSSFRASNVVVGVPATYTRYQRSLVVQAARDAGFDGFVGTITESTAAILAYGLFASTSTATTSSRPFSEESGGNEDDDDVAGTREREEPRQESQESTTGGEKHILVFDMGGGTTDVTIASMMQDVGVVTSCEVDGSRLGKDHADALPASEKNEEERKASAGVDANDQVRFQVRASSGDGQLGGDDMDLSIAKYFLSCNKQVLKQGQEKQNELVPSRELVDVCRRAKEELCSLIGDDWKKGAMHEVQSKEASHGNVPGRFAPAISAKSTSTVREVTIEYSGCRMTLSSEAFDEIVQPLVSRAEDVVDRALEQHLVALGEDEGTERNDQTSSSSCPIHEVVLVGGGSRVPSIRRMLRRKFPPPVPSDLCTSLYPEETVAQGAAIQAALLSGLVPRHVLRDAMMLDSLPYSIGVLVPDDSAGSGIGDMKRARTSSDPLRSIGGRFVPLLRKGANLPARAYCTFSLGNVHQAGVTVTAVEDVERGNTDGVGVSARYQPLGDFTFLLHRFDAAATSNGDLGGEQSRTVDIGMTVHADGKFIVSIFDWTDPEHLAKRDRYLRKKVLSTKDNVKAGKGTAHGGKLDDGTRDHGHQRCTEGTDQRPPSDEVTAEQAWLIAACVALFFLYVWAKIAFSATNTDGDMGESRDL